MKNMYVPQLKAFAFFCLLTIFSLSAFAQVGIGIPTPADASVLDVTSSTKGVLVPRMSISNLATIAPVTGGSTTSLLVYNTNTTTGPGFFFWNGSRWTPIDGGNDWQTSGNANTNPGTGVGENYLGTSDNTNLIVATDGTERMVVENDGQVSVNGGPLYSTDRFTSLGEDGERAISGYSSGSGIGVYGNNNGTGIGIYGVSASGNGVKGESDSDTGTGVYGVNTNTAGTGVVGSGNNFGGVYVTGGSGGAFRGATVGAASWATNASNGVGLSAAGNNRNVTTIGTVGAGGSFIGTQWGVTGIAAISGAFYNGVDRAAFIGRYVSADNTQQTVYVGARIGNTHYKILGTGGGSVSTTMSTSQGERVLFAPESPENWFFDIGEVQLNNGKAVVHLDKIFGEIIADSKPFKVFVQGSEGAMGTIRITRNIKEKSFLVEDLGGRSNGTVQYSIYAIWKGKENLRFPELKKESIPATYNLEATNPAPDGPSLPLKDKQ
ncbi:hypothetical protein A7A78_13080 [Aequorivita soesokkakensis]|uniref:Peptidase S74 domain-containing protein n=1 Tax=Aequorivita soesokkakensis TaxID=1385699 RepID=A0A1A9LFM0_9FLAO|nr:hypothetical protein [Aequorivita soesokkakensis]OAD91225.1 hypothetical protein A7A78_13080 [Aequorivita soesokkakensis]